MSKKSVIFLFIFIAIIGGIIYFKYYQGADNIKNILSDKNKTHYTVGDFKESGLDIAEISRFVDRLNKEYKALENSDKPYFNWINIGMFKKNLKDYQGVEDAWFKAISLKDDADLAYGNLADFYFYYTKDYQKAEEYYKKALDINKNVYKYYEGLADLYRYNLTDKKDLVEKVINDGLENDSVNKIIYYSYLVDFYHQEKNIEKKQEYIDKIKEIDPNWEWYMEDVEIEN